jgi:DHA3 family macrolide efflux protein-like MFS transporter
MFSQTRLLTGMRAFVIVWLGQMFSLLGTAMSGFALTVWAYEFTGKATALALVAFFYVTPMLVISPLAGALVDRSNLKVMMMLSDMASGAATIAVFILHATGHLQIWHLYITNAVAGAFQAFQWPAFSVAITTMLSKDQYGRANGMFSLAEAGSGVMAPILAAALLSFIGLSGVLSLDLAMLVFALGALLVAHVPQPQVTEVGTESRGSLWKESIFGFTYILKRPSLLGLQCVFMLGNFFSGISFILLAPMILARTGNNEVVLGTVNSIGAIGGVVGGLVMSAWGGTKRRVHGVLMGWALGGLFGEILLGLGRNAIIWSAAIFLSTLFGPIINSSNQAIWQAKVAPDVQGKVFSIRRLIAWVSTPLASLVAGPLADQVMEPAMRSGGWLTPIFSPIVGEGPGAGMSLIILVVGFFIVFIGLGGYAFRQIRDADTIMEDFRP